MQAIDWSAYLLSLLNKDEPLSASKIKSYGITIISVGFPIMYGAKYLSMFDINNIDLSQDVIVLDARDLITENFKFDNLMNSYYQGFSVQKMNIVTIYVI